MNDGFIRIGEPKKDKRHKVLKDYFVTFEIKYEFKHKITSHSIEEARKKLLEDFKKYKEQGDLFEWLEDEDCYCPSQDLKVKIEKVQFSKIHDE